MVPATQARWLEHVRAWKASGLPGKDYAARAGINARTLSWYASRLRVDSKKIESLDAVSSLDGFIEVIATEHHVREPLEIHVRGVSIRVPVDFDDTTLSRVLDILEARS